MDKELKKALEEYIRNTHNEILKSYAYSGLDIKRLIRGFNLDSYNRNQFTKEGFLKAGSELEKAVLFEHQRFQVGLKKIVEGFMFDSWKRGNRFFDTMVKTIYPDAKDELKWNIKSWNAIKNRKLSKHRTLSGRIWMLSNDYKRDLDAALSIGYLNGDSAEEVAKRIERYTMSANEKLKDIETLNDGQVHKSLESFKVKKKGSLGSVFKDAKRLAGNERNLAFREAENDRMNSYYVLGFKVNLSNAHPQTDICDFVNGDYPKDFKWNGWHPNCLCYRTFIVMSREDRKEYREAVKRGEEPEIKGLIKDVPIGFKRYMKQNYAQMSGWKSKPYFMIDNDVAKLIGG